MRFLARRRRASSAPSSAPAARSRGWAPSATGSPRDDVARVEVHAVVRATGRAPTRSAGSGVGRYRLSVGGEDGLRRRARAAAGRGHRRGHHDPAAGEPQRRRWTPARSVDVVLAHEVGSMTSERRRPRRDLPAQPPAAPRQRRRGDRAGGGARARRRRRGGRRRDDRGGRERGFRSRHARAARAGRTSWCAASPPRTRAPSWSSTPVRRCSCPGPTRWPRCCSRGSPARSSATRSPTSCSGRRTRRPAAHHLAVRGGLPAVDEAGRRRADLRRGALHRLSGLGPRRPAPLYRSATGWGTRRGRTTSMRPGGDGRRPSGRPWLATPARGAGARSCRSTRAAPATIERPVRWLAGFAAVEAAPGENVAATVTRAGQCVRALGRRRGAGRSSRVRSGLPPVVRRQYSRYRPRSRSRWKRRGGSTVWPRSACAL